MIAGNRFKNIFTDFCPVIPYLEQLHFCIIYSTE